MDNTSYVALSSQTALWRQMEMVANNMANANTPAYKNMQAMFTDVPVKSKSDATPFGRKVAFVQDIGTLRDMREGPMATTSAPLDLAISGDGYFTIDTPAGPRYTRQGHFRLDETGMMVTVSGYPVLQTNNMPVIFAPNESQITVAGDGTVSTENGQIGKLQIVGFDNDQALLAAGDGTYQSTTTPDPVDNPVVHQGMLEQSNVEPVVEMTHMMSILRTYEGVQNMIQNEHERLLKAMPVLSQSQQTS